MEPHKHNIVDSNLEENQDDEQKSERRPKKLKTKEAYFKSVIAGHKRKTRAPTKTTKTRASSMPLAQNIERGGDYRALNEFKEELSPSSPPPPASRAAILAGVLNQVKTNAPPEKQGKAKPDATRPTTTGERDSFPRAGYGNGYRYEPRDHVYTAVNFCWKGHKRLECDWYFSDLVEKRRWFLQLRDYRHDRKRFTNGVREHDMCHCEGILVLLRKLARMMHREMSQEASRLHGMVDVLVPTIVVIERRLTTLLGPILEKDRDDTRAACYGDKGDGNKDEKANKEKTLQEKAVERRKEAKKAAETARIARLMADQAERRAAYKLRAEKAGTRIAEAQTMKNDQDIEVRKTGQAALPRGKNTARALTKEEQKMLRGISAAQKREIDQAEREENKRQKQLSHQQEDAEESDGGLEDALIDAFEKASDSESTARAGREKSSKSSKVETAPSMERKKTHKPRIRPIVVDSSEESDGVKAPKPSKTAKPVSKPESKRKSKSSLNTGSVIARSVDPSAGCLVAKVTRGSSSTSAMKKHTKSKEISQTPEASTSPSARKVTKKVTKEKAPPNKEISSSGDRSDFAEAEVGKPKFTPQNHPTIPRVNRQIEKQAKTDSASELDQTSSNSPPSPGKRIRSTTEQEEPQCKPPTTHRAEGAAPSPPKKCKTSPPTSPGAVSVALSESSEKQETTSLASPGAVSAASPASSSSSNKRKMLWAEEDGEVTFSPGGTKRIKKAHISVQLVSVQESTVVEVAEESAVEMEDDEVDAKSDASKNSLFDE